MRSQLLLLLGAAVLSAASNITKEDQIAVPTIGDSMPVWSGRSLITIHNDRTETVAIRLFDYLGNESATFGFGLPGAPRIKIWSRAQGPGGAIALSGLAVADDGRRSPFLARLSPNGTILKVTATAPYCPFLIAFNSDGTILSVGTEWGPDGKDDPAEDYHVLRRFDSAGIQIGSLFPFSTLAARSELAGGYLVSGPDRVGWYTGAFGDSPTRYIEIKTSGEIVYYQGIPIALPAKVDGVAISKDGQVFATKFLTSGSTLYTLDRSTGSWSVVDVPRTTGKPFSTLLGIDEDRLVMLERTNPPLITHYRVGQ